MAQMISRIWKPFSGGSVTDAGVSVAILRTKISLKRDIRDRSRAREATIDTARDDISQLSAGAIENKDMPCFANVERLLLYSIHPTWREGKHSNIEREYLKD